MNEMTVEKIKKENKPASSCCNAPVKFSKQLRVYVCIICGKADR